MQKFRRTFATLCSIFFVHLQLLMQLYSNRFEFLLQEFSGRFSSFYTTFESPIAILYPHAIGSTLIPSEITHQVALTEKRFTKNTGSRRCFRFVTIESRAPSRHA